MHLEQLIEQEKLIKQELKPITIQSLKASNDTDISFIPNSVDWDKVHQNQINKLDFVLPGLLAGTVGGIVAQGATGKSYFGIETCCAIASTDILGLDIKQGDHYTTYITAEDPLIILENRANYFLKHLDTKQFNLVKKYVKLLSIQGQTPCLLNSKGERVEKWIDILKHIAKGQRLLIIDTLRKFHQGSENDSGHMTLLMQILDEIASETGCTILFTHHISKNSTGQTASRGSSALVDNIRWQILLENMTPAEAKEKGVELDEINKYVKINGASSKINYADKGGDHWLYRDQGGILVEAVFQDKKNNGSSQKCVPVKKIGGKL